MSRVKSLAIHQHLDLLSDYVKMSSDYIDYYSVSMSFSLILKFHGSFRQGTVSIFDGTGRASEILWCYTVTLSPADSNHTACSIPVLSEILSPPGQA